MTGVMLLGPAVRDEKGPPSFELVGVVGSKSWLEGLFDEGVRLNCVCWLVVLNCTDIACIEWIDDGGSAVE